MPHNHEERVALPLSARIAFAVMPILLTLCVPAMLPAQSPERALDRSVIEPGEHVPNQAYSPGLLAGDTLYVSGQLGLDPATRRAPEAFDAEVRQCLANLRAVLSSRRHFY